MPIVFVYFYLEAIRLKFNKFKNHSSYLMSDFFSEMCIRDSLYTQGEMVIKQEAYKVEAVDLSLIHIW